MFKKRTFWLLSVIIVIIAISLSGCGQQATEAPTEAPQVEEAPTEAAPPEEAPTEEPAPAEEPTEAPAPEPMEESVIVITVPEDPAAFNGLITDTGYEQMMGELIMLAVSEVDPDGNIFPELAAEIPTLENGGVEFDEDSWSMKVTWKLRDDIYWADGEQVTVDDVIFTWDTIAEQAWADGVDYTEYLEKIDDFTFVVHYYEGNVYPNYQLQFGGENFFVYPEHYCDAEQGFYEWDCDKDPLSSGPYILEEWVTNDHLTFVRNPNYFEAGKPAIDKVIVQIVPEPAVEKSMMLEGDADVHYWPGETAAREYEQSDNVNLLEAPTERWVMRLIPNMAENGSTDPEANPHPFLSDVRVRRAIRMAVDVETILAEIFQGYGRPIHTEFFRDPYICDIPAPEYDLESAAALLEEAGWTDSDGDGVRECNGCETAEDGTPMSMEFAIYAEYGEELELAQQLIGENLQALGFDVQLQIIEGTIIWSPAEDGGTEANGNFDLDMWDDGYPGTDPTDYQMWTFYYSEAVPEEGGWNVGRWANEDFDAWLDEAYTLDEEYRKEVFCELAAILEDELPEILLWSAMEGHGVSKRLNNVFPSVNDPLTWNVADWTLTE
jgi:peptide/nickel transport system substrate-binding protein